MASAPGNVTRLLIRMGEGDSQAEGQLFDLVYRELKAEAHRQMRDQGVGGTLETTALVHEAYLRLANITGVEWESRRHFLGVAAKAMRSILVDHARRRKARKRDPGGKREPLDQVVKAYEDRSMDLVALDAALHRLAGTDDLAARVVELRFFGGLAMSDVARVLEIGLRSAERRWSFARAWLKRELA